LYPGSLAYQFERSGYFALDEASVLDKSLVFNRVVTLKDTWAAASAGSTQDESQRSRGQSQLSAPTQRTSNDVIEDLRRVAFRVATIVSVNPHPEADSLLVCKLDCGDVSDDGQALEPRTVVASLAGKISSEDMVGRKVIAVTNLKPAVMRGIESHAMLLVASDGNVDDEKVELLCAPVSAEDGELISFAGKEQSQPDAMMKSKGALKAFARVKEGLRVNQGGLAVYVEDGQEFPMSTSSGPINAATLKGVVIQ
jgi:methionine--tRNA ligase beta chain